MRILPLLLGFAGGIAAALAFDFFRAPRSVPENPATGQPEIRALEAKLKAFEEHVARLEATQAQPQAPVAQATPPSSKGPAPFIQEIVKSQLKQQNERKLLTMKNRLHLSADQEARLKAYFDDFAELTQEASLRMLSGEKVNAKSLAGRAGTQTEEQMMETILTSEQKTEYKKIKEEERATQIETLASFELSQMAPVLNLTEQQKDPFFQAIAAAHQDLLDPKKYENFAPANPIEDSTRYLEIQNTAKLEAVKTILTPEQWELYREHLASLAKQQQEMMKAFLPSR